MDRIIASTAGSVTRVGRLRRRAISVIAVGVLALGLTCVSAGGASASVTIAGVTFTSAVDCGTTFGLQVTNTNSPLNSSFARAWVYDYSTRQWTAENTWHNVGQWSAFQLTGIDFTHSGYYYFWMQYAQYTTSGWQYLGEAITTYNTHDGWNTTRTTSCYIGV